MVVSFRDDWFSRCQNHTELHFIAISRLRMHIPFHFFVSCVAVAYSMVLLSPCLYQAACVSFCLDLETPMFGACAGPAGDTRLFALFFDRITFVSDSVRRAIRVSSPLATLGRRAAIQKSGTLNPCHCLSESNKCDCSWFC